MRPAEKPEIAALPIFATMQPWERERIFQSSRVQALPASVQLFDVGERPQHLHVVIDGRVELFTRNHDRTTTMAILRPVRSFILAAAYTDQPYLMAARTLAPSRILAIPAILIREAIDRDTALARSALIELSSGFRHFVRALTDMKLRQSTERLANYLLQESRGRHETDQFLLPIEKRMLASLLGMTPESLSRAFGSLTEHGVERDGMLIRITDRKKLIAVAKPDPVPSDETVNLEI